MSDETSTPVVSSPVAPELYQPNLFIRLSAVAGRVATSLPRPLLRLAGKRVNADGHVLDSDVMVSLQLLRIVEGEDFVHLSLEEGRQQIDDEAYLAAGKSLTVGSVSEQTVDGVRVRHYRPVGAESAELDLPTVVYLHGGGWVLGSVNSHDSTCRWLCARGNVAVLSVDYRLAPEHPFPAGLDDVMTVLDAAMTPGGIPGVDASKIAVAGDSAGGNLSAAACLRLRDEGKAQPLLQLLFVPVTNLAEMNTASHQEFSEGYFLSHEQMLWYRDRYVPDVAERSHPYVSPLLAEDVSGVAPAFVAVGGFDPLRDEGEAYAARLVEAGVPTTVRRHEGLVHPFVNSTGIWAGARVAMDEAVGALRLALGVNPVK